MPLAFADENISSCDPDALELSGLKDPDQLIYAGTDSFRLRARGSGFDCSIYSITANDVSEGSIFLTKPGAKKLLSLPSSGDIESMKHLADYSISPTDYNPLIGLPKLIPADTIWLYIGESGLRTPATRGVFLRFVSRLPVVTSSSLEAKQLSITYLSRSLSPQDTLIPYYWSYEDKEWRTFYSDQDQEVSNSRFPNSFGELVEHEVRISDGDYALLSEYLNQRELRVTLIPTGIPPQLYYPVPEDGMDTKYSGLTPKPPIDPDKTPSNGSPRPTKGPSTGELKPGKPTPTGKPTQKPSVPAQPTQSPSKQTSSSASPTQSQTHQPTTASPTPNTVSAIPSQNSPTSSTSSATTNSPSASITQTAPPPSAVPTSTPSLIAEESQRVPVDPLPQTPTQQGWGPILGLAGIGLGLAGAGLGFSGRRRGSATLALDDE